MGSALSKLVTRPSAREGEVGGGATPPPPFPSFVRGPREAGLLSLSDSVLMRLPSSSDPRVAPSSDPHEVRSRVWCSECVTVIVI